MMTMPRVERAGRGTALEAHTACPVVAGAAWRAGLPVLTGSRLTLRELRHEDAASLFTLMTTEEVAEAAQFFAVLPV